MEPNQDYNFSNVYEDYFIFRKLINFKHQIDVKIAFIIKRNITMNKIFFEHVNLKR